MQHPIEILSVAIQRKQPAALATVIKVTGDSPARVGAQLLLLEDGSTAGTVGGGNLEAAILKDAHQALTDGLPRLSHYSLTEEGPEAIGTLCGGDVRVFFQPFLPPPQLIIVGEATLGVRSRRWGKRRALMCS